MATNVSVQNIKMYKWTYTLINRQKVFKKFLQIKNSWQLCLPFWCLRVCVCVCAQGERDGSFSLQFAGLRWF